MILPLLYILKIQFLVITALNLQKLLEQPLELIGLIKKHMYDTILHI